MTRGSRVLLWLALGAAFSPVLADLVVHLEEAPWARYCLLSLPLLACATLRCDEPTPPRSDGYPWLALGLLLELFALGVDAPRLARPGIGLAVVGLYRAFGLGPARVAALAFWLTPVPSQIVRLFSPLLESALLAVAVPPVAALSGALAVDGFRLDGPGGSLSITPWDGGLPLAGLLSLLGWYRGVLSGPGLRAPLLGALAWGLAALPLQAAAVAVAAGLTASGAADAARVWLDDGPWLLAAAAGLGWTEWRRHGGRPGPQRPAAGVPGMPFASLKPSEFQGFEFRRAQADEGRDG